MVQCSQLSGHVNLFSPLAMVQCSQLSGHVILLSPLAMVQCSQLSGHVNLLSPLAMVQCSQLSGHVNLLSQLQLENLHPTPVLLIVLDVILPLSAITIFSCRSLKYEVLRIKRLFLIAVLLHDKFVYNHYRAPDGVSAAAVAIAGALSAGVPVNSTGCSGDGNTALHCAVMLRAHQTVSLHCNGCSGDGDSALLCAV